MLVLATTLGIGLACPPASADGPGEKKDGKKEERKEARDEKKEAKKDVKEAKDDLKDARKDLREALKDGGTADAQAVKEAKGDLKEARQKLKDTRDERRAGARTALKAKWGDDLIKKPAVRAELRLHAQRMAKLRHMKRVADSAGKKALEDRVDKLIDKEQARHPARMEALKAKNGEEK